MVVPVNCRSVQVFYPAIWLLAWGFPCTIQIMNHAEMGENHADLCLSTGWPGHGTVMLSRKAARRGYFLLKKVNRTLREYHMIHDGDRIAVAVSGGKDSLSLLTLLRLRQQCTRQDYELMVVHVQGDARGVACPPQWICSPTNHCRCPVTVVPGTGARLSFRLPIGWAATSSPLLITPTTWPTRRCSISFLAVGWRQWHRLLTISTVAFVSFVPWPLYPKRTWPTLPGPAIFRLQLPTAPMLRIVVGHWWPGCCAFFTRTLTGFERILCGRHCGTRGFLIREFGDPESGSQIYAVPRAVRAGGGAQAIRRLNILRVGFDFCKMEAVWPELDATWNRIRRFGPGFKQGTRWVEIDL
jgi:hypothetical protein